MSFTNIFLCNALLDVVMAGLTFLFFAYFRKIDPAVAKKDDDLPFITVLVPARNEGTKIRRCLQSLATQNYPNYEIVAIDDRSTDDTGEIIREFAAKYAHVKMVRGVDAPPGWVGKCNALVHGVKYASGQWFVFTDADTFHTPESLRLAVSYALQNNAELISFMPVQELGSFWERVVMPVLLGSFLCGDPMNTINDHTNNRAYAYGQYFLIRRDVYEAVGGHESVHDQILDDISFARVIKNNGYNVMTADGRPLYSVRMYTDLESLWQGWTKNLFALIECQIAYLLIVPFLINLAICGPVLQLGMLAYTWAFGGDMASELPVLSALTALQFGLLYAWYRRTSEHYEGVGISDFFLLPLGSLTVTVLYYYSAFLYLTGNKVSWKGRKYLVNTSKSVEAERGSSLEGSLATVAPTEPK